MPIRRLLLLTLAVLVTSPMQAAGPSLEDAIRSGDLEAALMAFERKTQSGPLERRFDLARIELLQGKTADAIEHLEWLVEVDPGDADFHLWFSRALFARATEVNAFRKPFVAARALEALERSRELAPPAHDSAIDLILVHLRVPILGGGDDAAREVAAELEPSGSPLHAFATGILAFEMEDWVRADEALTEAVRELEDPRRALFWLGYLNQRTQQWDEAFAAHEQLLELSPNDPRVWYELARTAEFSGQRKQLGRRMLERYLAATLPSGAVSREDARELLERLGR